MIPSTCNIIAEGRICDAPASLLVPGSVIYVKMGDKIPADFYIFKSSDFKVDNSSLTGEAEPQERGSKNTNENPLEASNLSFSGTLAVSGFFFLKKKLNKFFRGSLWSCYSNW
jgi:sodium/potassium-transporting ATPase subunit alpha